MLIIGNGRMVTRDEETPFYENGAVAVDADRIVRTGETEELKAGYPKRSLSTRKAG